MRNTIYLHRWDSIQWDFLFWTDWRIFSQKEFFIHYSYIYLQYSIGKLGNHIFSLFHDKMCVIPWKFAECNKPDWSRVFTDISGWRNFLLLTGKNMPEFTETIKGYIKVYMINESDFLSQIEPTWKNIQEILKKEPDKDILLNLWISRIIIAQRLLSYGRDFIDISSFDKTFLANKSKDFQKKLKKILLALNLYTISIKLYQIPWKIFKKK